MADPRPAAPRPRPRWLGPSAGVGVGATDFFAAQRANRRRTLVLLVVLTLIAAGLGYLLGWFMETDGRLPSRPGGGVFSIGGVLAALAIGAGSIGWSAVSLAWGGRMVLAMTGGREVAKGDEPQLVNVVEEMAIAAGQKMPRVFVIEDEAMNAFATGTSSGNAAIGVTRGLLKGLNREELQGVIGHEMGHIANLDTRYMTVVGVTVGLVALVSDMILRVMKWGPGRSSSRDRGGGGGGSGGLALILMVVLLVAAVVAPLAAKLVQFAVSRQREYLADATAVQFTRNAAGLISALQKLTAAAQPFAGASRATQHLFIVNPLRQFGSKASALMATHPATEDRIARLQALGRL
ncbi:M48 family metallopeptidase [Vineibacter terrae]|uniref:M48 family metallopeptidase n=1 Tax=Vineibacter terrae TaxID=2586908 RepID=UPI002E3692F8|nr:M48 family metallopeptidase [Vineibacter terrae]HEX2890960.1 M48 family metallopeptidase [Vineibacter terrae]